VLGEGFFEMVAVVWVMDPCSSGLQRLGLRIVLRHELNHEPRSQPVKELGQVLQRLVSRECEMMDQGEGQHQVRLTPLEDRDPFLIEPARRGGGVEQVEQKRKKFRLVLTLGLEVIPLDTGGIRVERDRGKPQLAGKPAEVTRIGPEVPDLLRLGSFEELRDQASLALEFRRRIGLVLVIRSPSLLSWLPAQASNRLPQAIDQTQERTGVEPAAARRSDSTGVLVLQCGVQEKVNRQAPPEARPPGQDSRRQIQRHSVDIRPTELAETVVAEAHQRQRSQKMLAELPVPGPHLPLAVNLERQGVDEDRPAGVELHVVSAAILESHAAQQSSALHFQRGERGVLKLAEAPFAGV